MIGIENYTAFIAMAAVIALAPGLDTVFVLNKSLSQGRASGLWSSLGVASGIMVHSTFAALGLSVILAQSAMAFSIVKYAGAAYLIYLGIKSLLAKGEPLQRETRTDSRRGHGSYLSGVLSNVLNPKVALFVIAFFPQFIARDAADHPLPYLLLGITYSFIALMWYVALALFSSCFSNRLAHNSLVSRWMNRVAGIVFILMGVKVALTGRK